MFENLQARHRRWTVIALWACTTSLTAAQAPRVSAIRAYGRTSLVFPSERPESAHVSSHSAREIRVTLPSSGCETVRLRSSADDPLIDAVTIRCAGGDLLEATIFTRRDVSVSQRSTTSRVYVDLTASSPAAPGPSTTSIVHTQAAALAAAGRVRDLIQLIDSLSAAERAAANRTGPSLDALLQQARERKLAMDRDLMLGDKTTTK